MNIVRVRHIPGKARETKAGRWSRRSGKSAKKFYESSATTRAVENREQGGELESMAFDQDHFRREER